MSPTLTWRYCILSVDFMFHVHYRITDIHVYTVSQKKRGVELFAITSSTVN